MKNIYNNFNNLKNFLDGFEKQGLYPDFHTISKGVNEPLCIVNNEDYLMFCANNYLGMSENLTVKEAAKRAVEQYGVGPGGSRVISGNIDIIEELERKISVLTSTEDCLTFPTGYMANVAIFKAVMDPLFDDIPQKSCDGVIFSDEYNHGSIVDGCRLSSTKKVIFKHNDIDDLRRKISDNDMPNKLIVTEGVFSLEGEIIDIPKYIEVARMTRSKLMIDDAHGVGILGKYGGGVGEYFNCADNIDILMGCLDKAMGGTGGYLCGSKDLIKYLRISSRSSLLSSALPVGMAGGMVESINQIQKGGELRKRLFESAKYLKTALIQQGFHILGKSDIPAIPLFIGNEMIGIKFSKMLWEHKVFCPIIRWPAVPMGESRFRIIVMATHTRQHLDRFIDVCVMIGKKLKII